VLSFSSWPSSSSSLYCWYCCHVLNTFSSHRSLDYSLLRRLAHPSSISHRFDDEGSVASRDACSFRSSDDTPLPRGAAAAAAATAASGPHYTGLWVNNSCARGTRHLDACITTCASAPDRARAPPFRNALSVYTRATSRIDGGLREAFSKRDRHDLLSRSSQMYLSRAATRSAIRCSATLNVLALHHEILRCISHTYKTTHKITIDRRLPSTLYWAFRVAFRYAVLPHWSDPQMY